MNKHKSKNYNNDDRNRSDFNKYFDHKIQYSSENCDISQKIKNLELEGLKLRSQVESILHETNEDSTSRTFESMNECESLNTISDQNAIYDSNFSRDDYNRSIPKSYDCKQNKNYNSKDNIVSLQKELDDCRGKLDFMHQKFQEETYAHKMEKEELVSTIENLKRTNFKIKSNNDRQLQEFKSHEKRNDSVVVNLKSNLNNLLGVNKKQEELLAESAKRLNELEGAPTTIKAFEDLRDLLIEIEYQRGSDFIKDQDIESCSPNIIVDIVDKCFKEFMTDLDDRSRKIRKQEDDMIQLKRNLLHDKEKTLLEIKNQVVYLEEQNTYLKRHINEITENADCELNKAREESLMLKVKLDNEMANATSVIDGLETNLQQMSNKLKRENENWNLEKKSMEKLLDENDKQTAIIRVERDQAINQKSSVMAKLDATQNKLTETETQLLQLQSDKYGLDKQIEVLKKRNKAIESSLSFTRIYLENITKSIRSSHRGDCLDSSFIETNSNNLLLDLEASEEENVPWRPRKYEIEEILHEVEELAKCERLEHSKLEWLDRSRTPVNVKIMIMNKKKNDSIEKYEKMRKEFEVLQKELDSVKFENKKLDQNLKALQLEVESSRNENSHLNSLIANRNAEIERLTAERDYYFDMLNEKSEDLANVKTDKHRLNVLLEERCRQLEMQTSSGNPNLNQNNEVGQVNIIDTSKGKNQILREERNRLVIQMNELQDSREQLLKNQKDQTVCIEHIKNENMHLQLELKNLYRDYDELVIENKRLIIKVKDADSEITSLCQELQHLKSSKSNKHLNMEKKICDLNSELLSYKNELKISQSQIKSLEKLSRKSNQNAQPPIILNDINKPNLNHDSLQITKSRLNSLEKQMNSMQLGHESIKEENQKLTELLRKVTHQNDRMAEELDTYIEENGRLREKINAKSNEENIKINKYSEYQTKNKYPNKSMVKKKASDLTSEILNNNESIHQLRGELQESIKEAKKLLASKTLNSSKDIDLKSQDISSDSSRYPTFKDEIYTGRKRSLSDREQNNKFQMDSNNNCTIESENVDSSTLNTKRSESTSMTEVDRHLNLPPVRQNDSQSKSRNQRSFSPIESLLSPVKLEKLKTVEKRNDRNTYELEEKIKRLLAESN